MGKPCPVCHKGMFREKDLMRHIKLKHYEWFKQKYLDIQGSATFKKKEQR